MSWREGKWTVSVSSTLRREVLMLEIAVRVSIGCVCLLEHVCNVRMRSWRRVDISEEN